MDLKPLQRGFFYLLQVGISVGMIIFAAPLEDYEETIVYKTHTCSFLPDVSGCRRIPLLGIFIH